MKPLVVFLRIIAVITLAELVTMTVLGHLGMKGGGTSWSIRYCSFF
jgi:hypothetical protein